MVWVSLTSREVVNDASRAVTAAPARTSDNGLGDPVAPDPIAKTTTEAMNAPSIANQM